MSGAFQKRAFQFIVFQVGRLFPRKLDCALNVAPRCALAAALRGPVALAQARPFRVDAPSRLVALSTGERVDADCALRELILSVHAVERNVP